MFLFNNPILVHFNFKHTTPNHNSVTYALILQIFMLLFVDC